MTEAAKAKVGSIGSVDVGSDGSCSIDDCIKPEKITDTNFCMLTAICVSLTGYNLSPFVVSSTSF